MEKDAETSLRRKESFLDEEELVVILEQKRDTVLVPLRGSHRLQATANMASSTFPIHFIPYFIHLALLQELICPFLLTFLRLCNSVISLS